ncbi:MAG: anti-sigma factor antagonist [Alphaproteobacteria bacterium]|nr:anti-sigma factor antagonist [Alphaproteobacteria bacterium]
MIIDEANYGSTLVLYPDGRLDQDTADAFQERLLQAVSAGKEAVIVDFSKIPYISSVGLRAIMIAAKQSKSDGVSLSVAALTPTVNEIFEISRFNYVVTIFESLRDAITAASDDALNAFEAG